MKLSPAEKVLADGSDLALLQFIHGQATVTDWRAEFEDIVDDFVHHLPKGYLKLISSTDEAVVVGTRHRTATVPLVGEPPFGLDLAAAIAATLLPDFEAHAFKSSLDSDTHCYLVRPKEWWRSFRAEFPRRYARIFGKTSALPDRFVLGGDAPAAALRPRSKTAPARRQPAASGRRR